MSDSYPQVVPSLAVNGGQPIRATGFAPWPTFTEEEIAAVNLVLRSGKVNYWTGEEGRSFEREFAQTVGCEHAIAVANGTVALELALYALGIGPGDEVITTCRTFIASASCIVARGATPVLADVDCDSQNITAETIRGVITSRTRAIIVVHLAGWPCDMDPILALADEHGLKVIEDCAQAHGARYKGRAVGSIGDVGTFSFCQDKIMTTGGEGGMLVTDDPQVWTRAWAFKDHGKNHEKAFKDNHGAAFRWLHDSFGTNFRLTEMQSAMGRVLLKKLPAMVDKRRELACILTERFSRMKPLRVTVPPADHFHSYYKYYAFLRSENIRSGWSQTAIIEAIAAEGIPCRSGSCSEIYLEEAFSPNLRPARRFETAKRLGETSLMFLVHPTLCERDMHDTADSVARVLDAATIA